VEDQGTRSRFVVTNSSRNSNGPKTCLMCPEFHSRQFAQLAGNFIFWKQFFSKPSSLAGPHATFL